MTSVKKETEKIPASNKKLLYSAYTLLIACLIIVLWLWKLFPFSFYITSTDDAYIKGKIITVTSQVSGEITGEFVNDYEYVKKGQLLFTIDDNKYKQTVASKKAELSQAILSIDESIQKENKTISDKKVAEAELMAATAEQERLYRKLNRYRKLIAKNAVSRDALDEIESLYKVALSGVAKEKAKVKSYADMIKLIHHERDILKSQIDKNKAEYNLAEIDLSHTQIIAPEDGFISDITMHKGQVVSHGSPLFFFIYDELWVIANLKETQFKSLVVGQRVKIKVDALGNHIMGKIVSFSPATTSEFSAFKSDNATGNFTKIVRRIPVKIELLADDNIKKLKSGMSVVVEIYHQEPVINENKDGKNRVYPGINK